MLLLMEVLPTCTPERDVMVGPAAKVNVELLRVLAVPREAIVAFTAGSWLLSQYRAS